MRLILLALFTTFSLHGPEAAPPQKTVDCYKCESLKKQMDAYNEKISALSQRYQLDQNGVEGCMNSLDVDQVDDLQKLHDQLAVEYNAHCGQKQPEQLWQGISARQSSFTHYQCQTKCNHTKKMRCQYRYD